METKESEVRTLKIENSQKPDPRLFDYLTQTWKKFQNPTRPEHDFCQPDTSLISDTRSATAWVYLLKFFPGENVKKTSALLKGFGSQTFYLE